MRWLYYLDSSSFSLGPKLNLSRNKKHVCFIKQVFGYYQASVMGKERF